MNENDFLNSKPTNNWVIDKETHEVSLAKTWAEAIENWNLNKRVRLTSVGPYSISTVFLGIDHSFRGPPVLFETMVFDETPENAHVWEGHTFSATVDGLEQRYCTWKEAITGHAHAVAVVQAMLAAQGIEIEVIQETEFADK